MAVKKAPARSNFIDRVVSYFDPRAGLERESARIALEHARAYDAAQTNRKTAGRKWNRKTGPNAVNGLAFPRIREAARDLVRNNPVAASAIRTMTAHAVGDGIAARVVAGPGQALTPQQIDEAQAIWDEAAAARIDGRHDVYGVQKLALASMVRDGDVFVRWYPERGLADASCQVLEADFCDDSKSQVFGDGRRVVQGVVVDDRDRAQGYMMYTRHPAEAVLVGGARLGEIVTIPADQIDHLMEVERPGQVRGVSRFASVALSLMDLDDISNAIREGLKARACIGIIYRRNSRDIAFTPATTVSAGEPVGAPMGGMVDGQGAPLDRVTPGMIAYTDGDGDITALAPSAGNEPIEFIRNEQFAICAALGMPYHMVTGDVSQANYSSLRASQVDFWMRLDDLQCNVLVPGLCDPMFRRIMRRESFRLKMPWLADLRAQWVMPPRHWVDPMKDGAAELMAIRSGLDDMPTALARRGVDYRHRIKQVQQFNQAADAAGLAFDSDPRRITGSGALQAATGYLAPRE